MGFVCDECRRPIGLRDRACRTCGKEYTVQAFFSSLFRRATKGIPQSILVVCPKCRHRVPPTLVQCPDCGADLTVEAAMDEALEPLKDKWEAFGKSLGPRMRRRIRVAYFLISAFVFWETLGYVEKHHAEGWILHAALSVLYLAVLLLLIMWLAPREKVKSWIIKPYASVGLGMVANYFTLMLLLQVFISAWWTRATILAGLFVVSWAGIKVFAGFLLPGIGQLFETVFTRPPENKVDPTKPQGRTGRAG